jgi:hypothetical protein
MKLSRFSGIVVCSRNGPLLRLSQDGDVKRVLKLRPHYAEFRSREAFRGVLAKPQGDGLEVVPAEGTRKRQRCSTRYQAVTGGPWWCGGSAGWPAAARTRADG